METKTKLNKRRYPVILAIAIILVLAAAGLTAYRLISGKPLGLRSFVRDQVYLTISQGKVLANRDKVQALSGGDYTNILFLHHSVGAGLIHDGSLRELLTQKGYTFWDQGYSYEGLVDPAGQPLKYTYNIPGDNTDPDGLNNLFMQKVYEDPINGFSELMQHEVIIFKSCFPINDIQDDQQLEEIKGYYQSIRNTIDQQPNKFFILLTTPPLNPAETDTNNAARARLLANWLKSEEFQGSRKNFVVYDLFDKLAEPDLAQSGSNMLREEFRLGTNSHPSVYANQVIAKDFSDYVDTQISTFRANND